MFVSEICAEGIFVTFPWWLKNVKSRSKIAPFPNERHFDTWFQKKKKKKKRKKKTITFFWSNYLNYTKKDPILHVINTFILKQGETRTSSGPIPPPLSIKQNIIIIHCFIVYHMTKLHKYDTNIKQSILQSGKDLNGEWACNCFLVQCKG